MDGRRLATELAAAAGIRLQGDRAEEIDHRAGELFDERNRDPRPLAGATELLQRLDAEGVTWAIATSSRPEQVRRSLDALGLSHAPAVVDGHAVEHAKPAPDLLLLAASQLGVDPETAWYVGDSTWDMRAAVAAQMHPVAVLAGAAVGTEELRQAGASVVLQTLHELVVPA
jgi:HAD superfamily hydrolase (TIGR01509 family)